MRNIKVFKNPIFYFVLYLVMIPVTYSYHTHYYPAEINDNMYITYRDHKKTRNHIAGIFNGIVWPMYIISEVSSKLFEFIDSVNVTIEDKDNEQNN